MTMNDLELVRGFRNEVPLPDDDVVARAYRRMLNAREAGGRRPPVRATRSRGRRVRVALGAAAVLAVMALVLPAVLPGGRPGGPSAALALEKASEVAAAQPRSASPSAGQYVYTKTQGIFLNMWADAGPNHEGFSVLMPETREAWIGPDGSGRLLETTGTPSFPTPEDEAVWKAAGSPDLGGNQTHDDTFPAGAPDEGGLFYLDLSKLPTDPAQLRQLIEQRKVEGGPPGDAETFTIVGDMLRETYAPPELRASLYQIVAHLSGVEYVGRVTDDAGRVGIAVAFPNEQGGVQHELVFNPNTSELLAERSVLMEDSSEGPAGTILSSATYLASGVVNSTDRRP
jgi:hypothetical protein